MAVWGSTSIFSRPQAESSDYSRHTAHFFAFFIFSSLQTPPLHNARRSIFNSFALNHLQIPLSATPLFSHPYKMPGVSPLLPPPNARPRCRTNPIPAVDCLPLRSAPSSTSPSQSLKTRRIISRHPSQEPTTWLSPKRANRRNPPASPTANRNRLHPNRRATLRSRTTPQRKMRSRSPWCQKTTKRKSRCIGKRKSVFCRRLNLSGKPI